MTNMAIQTINPLTEKVLENYPYMTDAKAFEVVQNSHHAFLQWRLKSLDERAIVISSIASELRKSRDEFAQLMTDEVGKLLRDSLSEIELCAAICDYTAKRGPAFLADEKRDLPRGRGLVAYAPLGVVYGIQPWNFPCYQAVRYSISSLMAGNGVLLKHSENCTGSGLMLRDIFQRRGLPKGLFGVLLIVPGMIMPFNCHVAQRSAGRATPNDPLMQALVSRTVDFREPAILDGAGGGNRTTLLSEPDFEWGAVSLSN